MICSSHERMQLAASRDLNNAFSDGVNTSYLSFLLALSTCMQVYEPFLGSASAAEDA